MPIARVVPSSVGSASGDTPEFSIHEFEKKFAEHVNSKSLGKQGIYATVGAGAASLIMSAVAPPLLPMAVIGGVRHGIDLARQTNKRDLGGYSQAGSIQRPTSRRLRHFVMWVEEKFSTAEATGAVKKEEVNSQLLVGVFAEFSPWLQNYYLLRNQGQHGEDCAEAWQTLLHLMPFYYLLQTRLGADAFAQEAQMLEWELDAEAAAADALQHRSANLAAVLDVIAGLDCLRPSTEEKLLRELCGNTGLQVTSTTKLLVLEPRAERRQRFQTLSAAIASVVNRSRKAQVDQHSEAAGYASVQVATAYSAGTAEKMPLSAETPCAPPTETPASEPSRVVAITAEAK